MKLRQAEERPGLVKLKNDIEKNKKMVRYASPITVENKGMTELENMGDELYRKLQMKKKKSRKSLLSRIF
ncbi:MAG: hypothetical protein K0S75_2953, partial [Clostridia bacterium]|nr:hypothetical protein [Clostridia bacterium]